MFVGLYCIIVLEEQRPVQLIVAAQAVTVVASPLVAGSLLWLSSQRDVMGDNVNGPLLKGLGIVCFIVLHAMSANTLKSVLGSLGWI
jgi:Mn2+/Fe2+ NRAMP family transporter